MECPRAYVTLVVLTLLQLCRAGHIHPQWYSARLNDERSNSENYLSSPSPSNSEPSYSSQPSFPTSRSSYPTSRQSFSNSQPIVVTHPSREGIQNNLGYSSSLPPPTSTVYSTTLPPSSTPVPSLYKQPQRHVKIESVPQNIPYPFVQTFTPSDQPLLDIEPRLQLVSEIPNRSNLHQHIEPPYSSSLPVQNLFQPQTQTTEALEPIVVTQPTDVTNPSNGNYVLVYQSSSQTASDFSQAPVSEVTFRETSPGTFSTVPVTRTSDFSTTRPSSFSTTRLSSFSTSSPSTTAIYSTTPFIVSTTPAPVSSTAKFTVTPSSTLGVTTLPCRDNIRSVPTLRPRTIFTNSSANSLRIRVIAPTGTITNVHINPQQEQNIKQTTTKKPKTKRTSKPKKNSYDRCLDGCKKVKDQICAAPLGHYSVSAKDLRSFPSVCHMACYNSFKKIAYEKAQNGNCDKLRRKIGNSNFIIRDDLKLPYSVVSKGSDTIIQLSKDVLEKK